MSRRSLHILLCAEVVLALIPPCLCMSDRRDPNTGKIRVLNVGADVIPGTQSPLVILLADALISHQTVPLYSTIFEAGMTERFMRIYMPRTQDRMKSDFDLLMISDATVDNFPAKYFPWMISSVRDGGLGFLTTGGSAMYGGRDSYASWDSSTIVEVFAVTFAPKDIYFSGSTKPPVYIAPVEKQNEFVASLPWDTAPPLNYMVHIVQTKQGATTLLKLNVPDEYPALSYWDFGNGRAVNLMFDWYPWRSAGILEPFQQWTYYIDFATNLIYFSSGVSVPQDLELVHSIRSLLRFYVERRTLLVSLLDFVEKFGANVAKIEGQVGSLDLEFARAQSMYRDQDWQGTKEVLEDLGSRLAKLDDGAIRLKDRALRWIYATEWFVVTATVFVCGFILWTLMVRRRLYGEVGVTRLR